MEESRSALERACSVPSREQADRAFGGRRGPVYLCERPCWRSPGDLRWVNCRRLTSRMLRDGLGACMGVISRDPGRVPGTVGDQSSHSTPSNDGDLVQPLSPWMLTSALATIRGTASPPTMPSAVCTAQSCSRWDGVHAPWDASGDLTYRTCQFRCVCRPCLCTVGAGRGRSEQGGIVCASSNGG